MKLNFLQLLAASAVLSSLALTGCATKRTGTSEVVVAPMGVPAGTGYYNGGAVVTNTTSVVTAANSNPNTVYFGLGSDRKEIKYYHKGKEIVANKHYQACLTEELKALADRMVRLEIRLKPIELNELRLQHGYDWDDETIQYILDKDYARLNLPKPVCELELPKNYLKFLSCYKSGTLIDCYKSSSIKRMKRDMIRLYGIELDNMA